MSKRDDSGDPLADILVAITIAIIGGIAGAFFASRQKKQNTVHLPDTLEALPEIPKPPFTFSFTDFLAVGVGSVSVMTLIGSSSLMRDSSVALLGLLVFAASFVGGFCAVKLWQKSQARKPQPPPPLQPEPFNLEKARAYTIALPHTTPWQPEVAYRFMEQILFKLGGRLTFRIIAVQGRIVWQILDLRAGVEPSVIEQAVLAYYPDAEISAGLVGRQAFVAPFYRYVLDFKQAADFVGPIRYVTDLKALDPLVAITQEMSSLRAGERIVYTLFAATVADFAHKEGEKLITQSAIHPLQFISIQGWMDAGVKSATKQNKVEKYVPADQKVFREKLNNVLYQGLFMVEIDAPTIERVRELSLLDSHVWQYVNQPYNALIWDVEPWPASIKRVDSAEVDRATSTFGLLAVKNETRCPGITEMECPLKIGTNVH